MRDYEKRDFDFKNASDNFFKKRHSKVQDERINKENNLISDVEKIVEKSIKQKQKKYGFDSNKKRIIYILGFLTCLTLVLTSYFVVLFNR